MAMKIRMAKPDDYDDLVVLIADFRVHLGGLCGRSRQPDREAAREELAEHLSRNYPIHVAEPEDRSIVGYLVCRVDGDVVWAESLFVSPVWRRRGVGTELYAEVERLAEMLGGGTVYNWVHPTNDAAIEFLRKRGYTVLNMIELRRPMPGEELGQSIAVGSTSFDYATILSANS
jgi:ribosomal protein S18 acetylase RimI-like enzyme